MPILWDGDIVVWDSLAIVAYLTEKVGRDHFWPKDDAAARDGAVDGGRKCISSFPALRRKHSMNIRQTFAPKRPDDDVLGEMSRIMELWAQARARFGGTGKFLFGDFGAVDIMYAPVCTRIVTYSLPIARFAGAYVEAVLQHPFLQDWIAAAQEEEWVLEQFEQPAAQ